MLRTISQLKDIAGKRVLVRVDFNVPIDKRGVADDTRIRETLPTIQFLLKKKAKVIVITHMGRPEGKVVEGLKLNAVAQKLSTLLRKKVHKLNDCVGKSVESHVSRMKNGEVVLLENIRFHPEEEKNDLRFTKALASLGDIFVNDAFAACHRVHASVSGIAKLLPAYAGFLVEREIKNLTPLLKKAKKPLTLIVGGAKVDTKIGLIKNYFGHADTIIIGGALANTFLAAEGYDVAASLYEREKIEVARTTLMLAEKKKQKIILPQDAIVADDTTHYARTLDLPLEDIEGNMKILDIGSRTLHTFEKIILSSKTIIWNGPLGLYEFAPFAKGTFGLLNALAAFAQARRSKVGLKLYIGGGDTVDALHKWGMYEKIKKITFVSTGGGAMLEFLEGKKLPGLEVLMK